MNSLKIKYLIIRFSSIGDIVLTTPLIRCLKEQVDDAEIHFITKKNFISIVSSNPFIDKVHIYKGNYKELMPKLKEEHFDYIIDLQNNFRSTSLKARLNIPAFTVKKLDFQKFLLVIFKINRLPDSHIVDRYIDTLSVFDVTNDGKGLDFFIPENESIKLNELPRSFQNGYVAFIIAGTYFTKRLPVEKVVEICNQIDFPVALIGGINELNAGEKIMLQSKGNVYNYAGKIDLYHSAGLVRDSNIVLTNDTGLMHIAAAFQKKILSFWGSTIPEFGMYPYMADSTSKIMEIKDLKCRPCSKLGYRQCPRKNFLCMNNLNVNKAIEWINKNFHNNTG